MHNDVARMSHLAPNFDNIEKRQHGRSSEDYL